MDAVIEINKKGVPIAWENEIQQGTTLFVWAPGASEAIAAVQLLLDQMGLHQYWYSYEVLFEEGCYQFEIVDASEDAWKKWSRAEVLAITTPNDIYKFN